MGPTSTLGSPVARWPCCRRASGRAERSEAKRSVGHVTSLPVVYLRRAQGETRVRAAEDLRTQVARRVELRRQICDKLLRCE